MFSQMLTKIVQGHDLQEEEMTAIMDLLMEGQFTNAQVGAFMAALATKGETFTELAGAARSMRRKATRIQTISSPVIDTCGTGGDGSHTFNISTTAAFVVAGTGVTVAKHGNRSISSTCGSADVLETLGVRLDVDPEIVEEAVEALGIGFLYAPLYHSAMRHAATARKEVGIRSIFNMLGPLTNPAGVRRQLLGVYAPQLTEMFAHALKRLGARRALVVHGHDGLDEVSVCAATRITELHEGIIRTYDVTPEQLLGRRADPKELLGGDPPTNAAILSAVLNGERGARRDVVVVNAAAALIAAGVASDFKQGIRLAQESIDSQSARHKLDQLIRFTQENA